MRRTTGTSSTTSALAGASMRVSNTRAKTELGWRARFADYHDGIKAMASPTPAGR
jgi:nucleoside-diphosphate-sugar epimerase